MLIMSVNISVDGPAGAGKSSVAKPIDFDEEKFFASLDMLYKAAYAETDEMKKLVHELVPTYTIDKRFE